SDFIRQTRCANIHSTTSIAVCYFFLSHLATTRLYTLSLHDALPILDDVDREGDGDEADRGRRDRRPQMPEPVRAEGDEPRRSRRDRKSTRLNSSHDQISYAVFCLKKKKTNTQVHRCRYAR